jgi:spermidine synthase
MVVAYLRLIRITLLLCLLLPIVTNVCSLLASVFVIGTTGFWIETAVVGASSLAIGLITTWLLSRMTPAIENLADGQSRFLDLLPDRWVPLAIAASAAGSLALELAIIRWHGTVWEIFAFYKTFSLLACFAGLGLGYALSKREQVPAVMVFPLVVLQLLVLLGLRTGVPFRRLVGMMASPIMEQLNMGFATASDPAQMVVVYFFLCVVMLLTALAFIPLGQVCGRLMERTTQLRAYALNLSGSIAGVVIIMVLSFLWTPPVLWFVPCFAIFILLQAHSLRSIAIGLLVVLAAVVVLDWPVYSIYERIYSPYQLIERGLGDHGLTMIRAGGHYYQRVHDLSPDAVAAYKDRKSIAHYYELPYRLHPRPLRVAVVGAGMGNDVAAALRNGVQHVDAIEIDPAILRIGEIYHPEKPYKDKRVTSIINDARTFLRATTNRYDLIIYGLLDSHTLLSHGSSVRLDSFVYTVEGLRDARNRLEENGVLSLSFSVLSPEIGRKIYLMMQEAFEGKPPICVSAKYDRSVLFAQSKHGGLRLDSALLQGTEFADQTDTYANPDIKASISTDDWPFFYMPRRVYPVSYVWMVVLILGVSILLFYSFMGEKPQISHAVYFFMGAGFMLVETKGITELGLIFGNTWQVIGIVIAAILVMAFIANLVVIKIGLRSPVVPFILLLASLLVGLVVAKAGGLPSTPTARPATLILLTSPMFFSGIAFSSILARTGNISAALAMNLFGAMCGGVLEYNSMYFGFQFLYWIAVLLYAAALVSVLFVRRHS